MHDVTFLGFSFSTYNYFISFLTDILLLYDGSYREPVAPVPCKKQTTPPSISISELYTDGVYPTGMEMPYTVSRGWALFVVLVSVYMEDLS